LREHSESKGLSGGPHQIALEDLVLDELPAINVLVSIKWSSSRMVASRKCALSSALFRRVEVSLALK
jgi:hypothetical protein